MSNIDDMLDALEALVWYCDHDEEWRSEHPEILENAEELLISWGVAPRKAVDDE